MAERLDLRWGEINLKLGNNIIYLTVSYVFKCKLYIIFNRKIVSLPHFQLFYFKCS